ncbi:MAG: class I SAM-dependent methyltransferase [Candidatus Binatia bacterium]
MADADEYEGAGARYYDPTYALLRDPSGDAAFYRALAHESGGPVLELGCGTGRVLLPIARAGIAATGLDRSGAMLAALRAKDPPPHLHLVCAPMQDFDLGGARFALVFAAFRALQHLHTVDDQLACLRAVRRHLAPGGRFAFDVFHPDPARTARPREPEEADARWVQDGCEVIRFVTVTRDVATQTLTAALRYERRHGGAVVGVEHERVRMRWFHRFELEHLLARAGFTIERLLGTFDGRPFDADAPEIVIVARAE